MYVSFSCSRCSAVVVVHCCCMLSVLAVMPVVTGAGCVVVGCTCGVLVGGAVQQRAAGQTAEDHRRHQLVHVHLLWTPPTAGQKKKPVVSRRAEWRRDSATHEEDADLRGTSMEEETDLLEDEDGTDVGRAETSVCSGSQ